MTQPASNNSVIVKDFFSVIKKIIKIVKKFRDFCFSIIIVDHLSQHLKKSNFKSLLHY